MLVTTTVILLLCMELNILWNNCDKRLLCILLPHVRFLFRYLFSPFVFPFIPPLASSLLSSGFFWRLSSSLCFTAWSSYFLCSSPSPGFVLGLLCSHYSFFSCSYFTTFWQIFPLLQPLLLRLPLPARLGSSRWKTGIRHNYPIWYHFCDGHDVYPTLAVDWSAYVFTLDSRTKKKTKPNTWHYKRD